GELASPGMPLVRLIGRDQLTVTAGVPSRFSDVVNVGDKAEVWFDFQSSDTLSLPITYVAESIDPQARTFKIEIALPANADKYKIDMIANVKLRTLQRENTIVVGEEYVYQKENGFVVYTVDENEQGNTVARERAVTLGPSYENSIVIEEGLNAGQQLITVGSSFLQNDTRVEVVENRREEFAQSN
ncbi:MAG: efflux RND transporter periplasmic adaptor subunit, partial [Balneolaceae bacterium]|nr:efflux RND transporter periplasmic adaptor subunit [Balneolaceae bacterium]